MYTLGRHIFETKKAMLATVGSWLKNEQVEFDALHDLIERHPDADQKIGCGIAQFKIGAGAYGGKCFHLVRVDGSSTDFSYRKCVQGEPSRWVKVLQAARTAVADDIRCWRKEYFAKHPNPDGRRIGEFDLDHVAPHTFVNIVRLWLDQQNGEEPKVRVAGDNETLLRFEQNETAEDFRVFHRTYVVHYDSLRLIEREKHR